MEKYKLVKKIAENVNWQAYINEQHEGEKVYFEFEIWTDTAGQDVIVSVVVDATDNKEELLEQLAHELNKYYESFDPEEEAALYWGYRHNLRGIPQSLRTLLKDMDEVDALIKELSESFESAC